MSEGPVTAASLLIDVRPDWISLTVGLAAVAGYGLNRLSLPAGVRWPAQRDIGFGIGAILLLWTVAGFPQARGGQLFWVWTVQQLLLLLIVPVILLCGQPVSLLRQVRGDQTFVLRVLASRPVRVLSHPLIGPALVPIACFALFFSGVAGVAAPNALIGGLLHVALLIIGVFIALPLVDVDDDRSSLAVALSLGVGFFELIMDAFPGIVLRFQTHPVVPYFVQDRPAWAGSWLADQHTAGSILWAVAEVLDVPFLLLAGTRWLKADAREAADADAQFELRSAASRKAGEPADSATPVRERPWWEDDPELKARFRN